LSVLFLLSAPVWQSHGVLLIVHVIVAIIVAALCAGFVLGGCIMRRRWDWRWSTNNNNNTLFGRTLPHIQG
jgi:hypothetical protein